jgi:membrane protein DedA with SNARE-associated domain
MGRAHGERFPRFRLFPGPAAMLDGVLITAAISDTLFNTAADTVADLGLLGIFFLMLLDAACVPIPSEATMLFGGFAVSQGQENFLAVILAGLIGNLVGSLLAFLVGRYGRRWIDRRGATGRLLSRRHLATADRWFERYGAASVLFARVLPVARTFISLPAGASKIALGRFMLLTALGCLPWVLAWALLGDVLGQNWDSLRGAISYADYVVLALAVAGVVYLLARRTRRAAPQ